MQLDLIFDEALKNYESKKRENFVTFVAMRAWDGRELC